MYFHTDTREVIGYLADSLKNAGDFGKRVRIDVDSEGCLKIKIGEGIWSPPFTPTHDPYRDNSGTLFPVEPPIGYRWGTPDEVEVSLNGAGIAGEVYVHVGVDSVGSKCYDLAVPETEGN